MRAVFEGLVVAAVLGFLLHLRQWRHRRAARRQIAEQLLRVLGLRLRSEGAFSAIRTYELVELPPESLRGRDALPRLQWQIDLHRAHLSFHELTVMQSAIDGLERVVYNPGSASHYYAKDALPKLLRAFLPYRAQRMVLDHVEQRHWSELLATRADFLRQSGEPT